jgi:hypothetical protein
LKYVLLCHDIEDTGYGIQGAGEEPPNPILDVGFFAAEKLLHDVPSVDHFAGLCAKC